MKKSLLLKKNNIVENDKKTAGVFNNFFSIIITNLGIPQHIEGEPVCQNIDDPLMKAITKHRLAKKKCISSFCFSFSQVERDEIIKEINNLKTNKATQSTDIPTKFIKEIISYFTTTYFNNNVFYSIFPSPMKNAIITSVYKKGKKTSKDNYRPVRILSNASKMFKQISGYFEHILSKFQCGFRKGFSAQHCLLSMLEKRKTAIDNKKPFVHFLLICPKLLKANPDKCHFICSSNSTTSIMIENR